MLKSIDSGGNWIEFNNGLDQTHILALAISTDEPTVLYAGTDGGIASFSFSSVACQATAGQVLINEVFPSPSNEWNRMGGAL